MLILKCIKDVYIEGTDKLAFKEGLYYPIKSSDKYELAHQYKIKHYTTVSELSGYHILGNTLDNDFIREYFIVEEIK